jgi:hypothetical protein
VVNPDGSVSTVPSIGPEEAAVFGAGLVGVGIALCDGPEPGPADLAALEFIRRALGLVAP